jgi:hypothetical protein
MCYDDSPKRSMVEKIEQAMDSYQARFARVPTLVWVHTSVPAEVTLAHTSIERRSSVPPNHVWAGMQPEAGDSSLA